MAMPETVAEGGCDRCGKAVAVKKNRDGRAYYQCQHCGWKGEAMTHTGSRKYLETVAANDGEPEAGKKPEKAAPPALEKPAQPTAQPVKPSGEKTQKAEPELSASEKFLRGVK